MLILFEKIGKLVPKWLTQLEWFQRKELKYQASMYKQRFSVHDIIDVTLLVSL